MPRRTTPLRAKVPLKAKGAQLKRSRIKPVSDKRRAQNVERRRNLHAAFGARPRCALCVLRRSAGGSITDPANVRPVGRRCHRWATEHPGQMRAWGLEASRYGNPES